MPDVEAIRSEAVPVALLCAAGDLGGHLKDALNELGAAIVYESQASNLDQAALAGSGARIVVFNLDPESEGEIDQVCEVLDQGGYEVVFNDADASARLSGTDQARWARHLAAKILHKPEIAEPPRPAWAESVPSPSERAAASIPSFAEAAPVQAASSGAAVAAPPPTVELPAVEDIASAVAAEPVSAESLLGPLFAEVAPPPAPPAEPAGAPASAATATPTLELGLLDEFLLAEGDIDVVAPTDALQPAEPAGAAPASDFASALEDFAANVPAHKYEAQPSDEFASEIDALFAATEPRSAAGKTPAQPVTGEYAAPAAEGIEMAEFPALFDQVDAAASSVPEAEDGRFSYKPAPLPPKAAEVPAEPPVATAAEPLLPPDWSLEPLDEGTEVKPLAGKSTAFGIETMSATDFLAPADEEPVAPPPISPGLSLELVPMEDAVAPQDYAAAVPATPDARSAGALKVGAGAHLRRVVVLGASIGGPEAVREFLGALPRDFPALFVLAQHMGDEFLELMSMQLAKAVSLTVRTPTHGERVGHGEVVIVPTRQRMQIDSEGVITLSPLIERTAYSPSIDQVMRDLADEFGDRAAAIVFSGMAQDAIEGSKYLKGRGGAVWVQDPDTCTISTMVESVRQTGAVEYAGSPQQLAAKMVADFGKVS